VPLLGALGAVAFPIAIVLFAVGAWIAGMILLGLSLALVTLFLSGVRGQPDSRSARLARSAVGWARSLTRLTAVSARAWSRAALDLVKIRRRQRRLRHQLRDRLAPLGEAVCHDDQRRAEALKARASELEQALRETERQASAAVGGARRQIERERAPSQPTQPLPAPRADAPAREDGRSGKPSGDRQAARPRAWLSRPR